MTYRLLVRDSASTQVLAHVVIKSDTTTQAKRHLLNYVAVRFPFRPPARTTFEHSTITTYV